MVENTKELAWKEDIPPVATPAQIEAIKAQLNTGTANVNMRPYHVYSPNEQVVGEWQEMIDGVLKKKPVYEKNILNLNVALQYNSFVEITDVSDLNIERFMVKTIMSGDNNTLDITGSGLETLFNNGKISIESNQSANLRAVKEMIIQYTKTTDQWAPV